METEYDSVQESDQVVYPGDMVSTSYESGFNNWSNWGNGPTNPARTGKDLTTEKID